MKDVASGAEISKVRRKDDEIKPEGKTGKKYEKITREELKKKQAAERERRRLLEKEKEEVEKSAERIRKQAEKITKQVTQARTSILEAPQSKVEQPQVPSKGNPVIVESYPHFSNQPREVVQFLLKKANVDVELPSKWDKWDGVQRSRWMEKNGLEDMTKLPDIDESTLEAGFIHKVKVKGLEIGLYKRRGKDEYVVGGLPPREWKCETFTRIFKNAGVDIEIPASLDSLSFEEKFDVLSKLKIKVVPEVYNLMPGVSVLEHNDQVEPAEAYRRLSQLRAAAENINRTAVVPVPPSPPDVDELQNRLARLDVQRRIADINTREAAPEIINRLVELQHLEERYALAGANTFIGSHFDQERAALYDRFLEIQNRDGRISDVLGTILGGGMSAQEQLVRRGYLERIVERVRDSAHQNQNFRFVFNAAGAVEDFERIQIAAGNLAGLNAILRPSQRNLFRAARNRLDQHFRVIEATHTRDELNLIYDPVDKEAFYWRRSLGNYIGSVRDIEQRMFDETPTVRNAAQNEPLGEKGLVEWHTVNTLVEMDRQQAGENDLNVPLAWEDSLKNVNNNLRFIESGDFSADDLGPVRQRIVSIAERLRQRMADMNQPGQADERRSAEEMLNEINEVKDAVLALYDLRLAMEASDMNPQKVLEHFSTHIWKDTTFKVYFQRFDMDENGEYFEIPPPAGAPLGTEPIRFNMQDKAMQVVFKQIALERKVMNQVEALTIVGIENSFLDALGNINPVDSRFAQMARIMGRTAPFTAAEMRRFEMLREEFATRMTDPVRDFNVNQWANTNPDMIITFNMKTVINEWYRENLLLGAHGTHEAAFAEDPYVGRQRLDMRREDMLRDLRDKLIADGVDPDNVEQYDHGGLLNQVMNNAYHLSWSLGAFSDYDGIRVWDRSKVWFRNNERGDVYQLGRYVFNNGTTWFNGRMVDHFTEFLQDEFRGRPRDVNHVFASHMIGKKRGLLGHNRLMVKIIGDNLSWSRNKVIRDSLVKLTDAAGNLRKFSDVLTEKQKNLENIQKLNVGDRVENAVSREWEIKGGEVYDNGWARGAAIEELLEDGDLSFENVEWSKVFTHDDENVRKFNMGDWWSDRAETHKFFAAGAMQEYLKNPGTKFFFKMNREIFYSKREIRIQPWMKIVIPAHQEIGRHWQEWWKLSYDMPHAETKRVIDDAVRFNMLDAKYRDQLENNLLGWGPFNGSFLFGRAKALRYLLETADRNVREFGKRDWELLFFWPFEFFKVAGQQSVAQLAGK